MDTHQLSRDESMKSDAYRRWATIALAAIGIALIALLGVRGRAHAQDRPAATRLPPVELVCVDAMDVHDALQVAQAVVGGAARVEAERSTNCLVVVGAIDVAPLRRVLTALEDRARARAARTAPADGPAARPRQPTGGRNHGTIPRAR